MRDGEDDNAVRLRDSPAPRAPGDEFSQLGAIFRAQQTPLRSISARLRAWFFASGKSILGNQSTQ